MTRTAQNPATKNPGKIALFFTHDVSLKLWKDTGLFEREVRPYLDLARQQGREIVFVTCGDDADFAFAQGLSPIKILPAYAGKTIPRSRLVRLLGSPLVLYRYRRDLATCAVYKTNQFWGGWNAVFAKWLWRGKVIGRQGYEYLAFARAQKQSAARIFLAWLTCWLVYRFADRIVLATREDADFAQATFGFLKGREINIQPNWVDTDAFKPLHSHAGTHAETLADLVYIGRFNAQKNLPALIRAAALSGASLDLYGGGELEPKLKALAAETGAKVTFRGRVANDRIPALLAQYKAFILPSLFEGNPKALLEAMACGCAVIASDAPGIAGLITHGENGYLCAPDNEAALAAAIRTVLDDGELRARMGLAARDQVCRHNSYAHYINEETKRIESITGS